MEYKKEAFDMFEQLLMDIKRDAVILLAHAQLESMEEETEEEEIEV